MLVAPLYMYYLYLNNRVCQSTSNHFVDQIRILCIAIMMIQKLFQRESYKNFNYLFLECMSSMYNVYNNIIYIHKDTSIDV